MTLGMCVLITGRRGERSVSREFVVHQLLDLGHKPWSSSFLPAAGQTVANESLTNFSMSAIATDNIDVVQNVLPIASIHNAGNCTTVLTMVYIGMHLICEGCPVLSRRVLRNRKNSCIHNTHTLIFSLLS